VTEKSSLRSGEVARLIGVSADTLRLYERKGLVSPLRAKNGYRCYSPKAVARLRLIRAALSIGFTINELAGVLKIRDAGGAPCRNVRTLANLKLRVLDRQIEQLSALRVNLQRVLNDWDAQLKTVRKGECAGLLERLASASPEARVLPPYFYAALSRREAAK
jgi:DNA-binding transcriptional MerR regulator